MGPLKYYFFFCSFVVALKEFKACTKAGLRDACNGALWELYEGQVEITDSSNEDSGSASNQQCPELHDPHVMISYQWDSQEQMIAVKEMLIAEGYNVWMDVDKMGK